MKSCNCPNCNAQLNVDEKVEYFFCNYCGTKLSLYDSRTRQDIHIYNESEVVKSNNEKEIELEKIRLRREKSKSAPIVLFVAMFLGIALIVISLIFAMNFAKMI